ncbi:P-loop containing nucleoside triphosphate hydrolase protein [Umbelopsis sp. AD052]|nr:P-loop containing nucleoside triphosphate hydrolase protein [Umbelopsis sp. AD052]
MYQSKKMNPMMLRYAPVVKMSSKKKKRLDKYIEQKLKKDARAGLLEKLSSSAWSSELLLSSRKLGQNKETMREKLRRALNEEKAGIHNDNSDIPLLVESEHGDVANFVVPEHVEIVSGSKKKKKGKKATVEEDADAGDLSVERSTALTEVNIQPVETDETTAVAINVPQDTQTPVVIGGALKQTADGQSAELVKRKRKKKKSTIPEAVRKKHRPSKADDTDSSFDSSDSEYDAMSDSEPAMKPKSQAEEDIDNGPTALEQAVEAVKGVKEPVTLRVVEEDDEIKKLLLERNRGGDLSHDDYKPFYVSVKRKPEIQAARLKLPVCGEEQVIMEAIRNNTVVIICGETGSGKTTQVPQFLYEAGFSHPDSVNPGLIGVTQPRRVAAVSMASRVSHELNVTDEVSHQIRYDTTTSKNTRIKFMTDGVLLRELAADFLLTKYSVLIIDEAHERNLNTDILIGVISRVLKLRANLSKQDREKIKPLRVVIMSATLRVTDFTQNKSLFDNPPPVIKVDARQYPVSIHFNKRTPEVDYVDEAYKKIGKIHKRLPPGGILVFLTGQQEIVNLCKKLRQRFPTLPKRASKVEVAKEKASIEAESRTETVSARNEDVEAEEIELGDSVEQIEDFDLPDSDEEDDSDDELGFYGEDDVPNEEEDTDAPLHVLPLYSLLPTDAQMRVFEDPPEGTRLCIVATNVAETSVTIPGIRYVVDAGKVKERQYNLSTGIQSFDVDWTSKASADQRAGRAGRTGPGHCYRLYSSAVFDNYFSQFSVPEINRMPIEGVILSMKSMYIDNVVNFPFPTPPPKANLMKAEKILTHLGAIDRDQKRITDLGRSMATFPIIPKFAKMLIIGQQHGCLPFVIAIVSALSVGDPVLRDSDLNDLADEESDSDDENGTTDVKKMELHNIRNESVAEKERRKLTRSKYYQIQMKHAGLDPTSDIIKLLNVVGAYEYAGATQSFCETNFVRPKAMEEIRKLRRQLTNLVVANCDGVDVSIDPKMQPPSTLQLKVLRQILTAGFIDSIAVRKDYIESGGSEGSKFKSTRGVPYRVMWSDEDVFIHPSSVLYHQPAPLFVAYNEQFKSSKVWLKGVTKVEPKWLAKIGKAMCTYGKPLEFPVAKFMNEKKTVKKSWVVPSFGPKGWPLPPVEIEQKLVGTRWVFTTQ